MTDCIDHTLHVHQAQEVCKLVVGIPSGGTNTMQYVTIATTGNATDFGDLTDKVALSGQAALSDVNGGLG